MIKTVDFIDPSVKCVRECTRSHLHCWSGDLTRASFYGGRGGEAEGNKHLVRRRM